MAMYLGSKKVAVTNTVEKQVPSMKDFFEAGGKCAQSTATSFEGIIQYSDTENVTNMSSMFYSCAGLNSCPRLNTSKVINMNFMFHDCQNLISVSQLDTSNVLEMYNMFGLCKKLTTVPPFDVSKVYNLGIIFEKCSSLEEIHMININADLNIAASTRFTREALLEIIGNLKAQTSGNKTLTMGSTNLDKLTDADKKIATDKGWTLA